MSQAPKVKSRERPCATCGYDLRGAVSERCPECGVLTPPSGIRGTSRIPWVRRREIGRVKAYFRTLWLIIRRPNTLAAEADRPVERRAAKRFARVSILLAVAIGTALVGVATWKMEGPRPNSPEHFWGVPFIVFADSPLWLAQLAASLNLSAHLLLLYFQSILTRGTEGKTARGRAWRTSLYVSGLMPVVILLLGLSVLVAAAIARDDLPWMRPFKSREVIINVAVPGMILLASALVISTGLHIVRKWGKGKWLRGALVVLFLPVSFLVLAVVAGLVFWITGYVAIAFKSMLN